MGSMNVIRLASNQTGVLTTPFRSVDVYIQGVREETVTIWGHTTVLDGSQCLIKVAPIVGSLALGGQDGMILHTIITSGTAGANQTKVNTQGFFMVNVQAMPLIHIRLQAGLDTASWTVFLVE